MHNNLVVVEKRTPEGALDFTQPQPPSDWIGGVPLDAVYRYFQRHNPAEATAGPARIGRWYRLRGWYVRPKTW